MLYRLLIEEKTAFSDLDLEDQSLYLYFTRRLVRYRDMILVRIPEGLVVNPQGGTFVLDHEKEKCLRVDCLRDTPLVSGELHPFTTSIYYPHFQIYTIATPNS